MDKYLTMFSAQLDAALDGLTIKTVNTSDIRISKQDIYLIRNKAPQITSLIGWINRLALVIIYAWFGFFKIIDLSPAEGLVTELHRATFMHHIPIHIFLITLGIAECFIGVLWLFPKLTKIAFIIFILHVITTFLPLFFLPNVTWSSSFILTMEGQYIVKNVVLIACAINIFFDYKKNSLFLNNGLFMTHSEGAFLLR